MVIFQADPGWDQSDATRAPLRDPKTLAEADADPDGFHDFLTALRDETIAFRRPVVAVDGDSHYFRIDKPLQDAQGRRVENFTRVETFGDHQENGNNDVHWLQVKRRPAQPRGLLLSAADRAGQPHRCARSVRRLMSIRAAIAGRSRRRWPTTRSSTARRCRRCRRARARSPASTAATS